MAINVNTVRTEAANAVLTELTALYKDADADGMRDFAEKGVYPAYTPPNVRVTSTAVLGGALGVIGGVLAVRDLANQFAGRVQVDLEGLDPGDFEVGHEFKQVHLGESYYCDIRVERNIIFRRKFFIVRAYVMA